MLTQGYKDCDCKIRHRVAVRPQLFCSRSLETLPESSPSDLTQHKKTVTATLTLNAQVAVRDSVSAPRRLLSHLTSGGARARSGSHGRALFWRGREAHFPHFPGQDVIAPNLGVLALQLRDEHLPLCRQRARPRSAFFKRSAKEPFKHPQRSSRAAAAAGTGETTIFQPTAAASVAETAAARALETTRPPWQQRNTSRPANCERAPCQGTTETTPK